MSAIPEQLFARQKSAIDTVIATQSALFSGFEKLIDLNMKVMRATLDEVSQTSQQAAGVQDPQEALTFATSIAQPNAEKALAYGKHVYDIVAGVQGDLAKLSESQVADAQKQMADVIDQMAKSAPTGSEGAVAMLKSSLATANSAYDSMTKAAKQAAEVAETNLNAATNASFKAASDAADAANKVASRTRRTAA
ncbi:TIGR01841 family phasin [Schauerella aestuarii]|jgi:phasin family protein|uniref:TIGR01841 family phasin n=1 Tax=Schauerella aestuarii TaxID=2511204 RepID=UPI00136C3CD1|nr:TIGR01841 family phasin [Achromobacter aestuarii]MYZ42957.1 phasin family protein [Achromobacter aestuarii]